MDIIKWITENVPEEHRHVLLAFFDIWIWGDNQVMLWGDGEEVG